MPDGSRDVIFTASVKSREMEPTGALKVQLARRGSVISGMNSQACMRLKVTGSPPVSRMSRGVTLR